MKLVYQNAKAELIQVSDIITASGDLPPANACQAMNPSNS